MTQKEQKKKTLDEILWDLGNDFIRIDRKRKGMLLADYGFKRQDLVLKAKQQILELIKGIVPEEKDPFFRKRKDSLKVYCNQMRLGANQAIDEMNKRIKDL